MTESSDPLDGGAVLSSGVASMASPRASASTPISPGTSLNSTGVEATQTPSRQWLSTILRCSGCLVTRSVAP
jgi:hypothetical protein